MSLIVSELVWKHSIHKGSERLVLLAIARYAKDDGTGAWPSLQTLAGDTNMSPRAVQYAIHKVRDSGELVVEPDKGPRGCNLYSIPLTFLIGSTRKDCVNSADEHDAKIAPINAKSDMLLTQNPSFLTKPASPDPLIDPSLNEEENLERVEGNLIRTRETSPPTPIRSVDKSYSARRPSSYSNGAHSPPRAPAIATRLPSDFAFTRERQVWAEAQMAEHQVHLDAGLSFKKFTNYFSRGKGKATELEDWEGRWERWLLDDISTAEAQRAEKGGRDAQTHRRRAEPGAGSTTEPGLAEKGAAKPGGAGLRPVRFST